MDSTGTTMSADTTKGAGCSIGCRYQSRRKVSEKMFRELKDNCFCCNCEQRVMVERGEDRCPLCGFIGALSWVDGEEEEVEGE